MTTPAPRFDPMDSCRSKRRYPDEAEANRVAALVFSERRTWLRAYLCDGENGCGGWHLTKSRALPPAGKNWSPPKKSQRQLAREKNARRDQRRRRIR